MSQTHLLDFKSPRYDDRFVLELDEHNHVVSIRRHVGGRITLDPIIYYSLADVPAFHRAELEQFLYTVNRI